VNETKKVYVFDVVTVRVYHEALIQAWLRLSKDGMVARDDEETFAEVGCRFVAHICRTRQLPDYGSIVGWIPEIMGE
jgi:hypothetical protein